MHIVMFGDQHLESLGGAQVSMRLQKRFLEKAGHTVTVVAPRMHRKRDATGSGYLDLPSVPITLDREYSFTWPGRRTDRWLDRAMRSRPPVDVVHVQADFWGAVIGHRFAARHDLPVVHTMHNRVDVGIEAVAPFPRLVLRALNAWQRRALPHDPSLRGHASSRPSGSLSDRLREETKGADGWAYLRRFAERSAAVTAPSSHFAHRLEEHGVVPARADGTRGVDVVWNGIDDDLLDDARSRASELRERADGPARFIWVGRMSPEKRLLPFLEAVIDSGVRAAVEVIGGGGDLRKARKLIENRRPRASIAFLGRLPYTETLRRIGAADAVVQTSIGFETQGMTVFEAAALGTPSLISDPDIGGELASGFWPVADSLVDTLSRAAADIDAGAAPRPNPKIAEQFRQSSRTDAMLEVYRRVTG